MSFSYPELAGIIKDAEKLLQSVNGEPKNLGDVTKKIQIRKNGMQITFLEPDEMKNYEKKPEVAYEFSYSYYYPKGKISQVNLDFGDLTRKISIEGTDANQIDALFSLLKEKIEGRQSIFGGGIFRLVLFWGIFLFLMLYVGWAFEKGKKIIFKRVVWAIGILIGLLILYNLDWFQGTAIYSGDASFIVRYSAHIGLLGLVVTFISLLLPYLKKEKPKPSLPPTLTEPAYSTQIVPAPPQALVKRETKSEVEAVGETATTERERTVFELESIASKLKETPPAQIPEVEKNYLGIWARGKGSLLNVRKIKERDDLVGVAVYFNGGIARATVLLSKYPELALMKKEHQISIEGKIKNLDNGVYELSDAKLSYNRGDVVSELT